MALSICAGVKNLVKAHTTYALRRTARDLLGEFWISRLHHAALRRSKPFSLRRNLKLNLGCGLNIKPGWINIDASSDHADLRLDLREAFPFPDHSVSIVYSEHFFEHLEYPDEALKFLKESWRVLIPGGICSIGIPDFELSVISYVTGKEEYYRHEQEHWRDRPKAGDTRMHFLNHDFRQGREHKYAYDFETLTQTLVEAGFTSIVRRAFDPTLDSPRREWGTLYVDARK